MLSRWNAINLSFHTFPSLLPKGHPDMLTLLEYHLSHFPRADSSTEVHVRRIPTQLKRALFVVVRGVAISIPRGGTYRKTCKQRSLH